ncbi:sunset domain-containing protein [Pseudomonas japonica]
MYHLPGGSPSYGKASPINHVAFKSAAEAKAAGFHQAADCG